MPKLKTIRCEEEEIFLSVEFKVRIPLYDIIKAGGLESYLETHAVEMSDISSQEYEVENVLVNR